MADKTKRLLNKFKEKRTPVGTNLYLPNHSGDHVRSIKRAAPVGDKDLVNKEYVDGTIATHTHSHADTTGQTANDHHSESHTVASHSDTSATGAQLNTLTDDSMANTLHRHSELSASDGTPNPCLYANANGNLTTTNNLTIGATLVTNGSHWITNSNTRLLLRPASKNGSGTIITYSQTSTDNPIFMLSQHDGSSTWYDITIGQDSSYNFELTCANGKEIQFLIGGVEYASIVTSGTTAGLEVTNTSQAKLMADSGGRILFGAVTNHRIDFLSNNARVACLRSNGMVIGSTGTNPACRLDVEGAIRSATTTLSVAGPTDNLDVSGVNVIFIDTSSNNVTLGGMTGGVAGQVIHIAITDATNNFTLEHNEGTGNQDIFLQGKADTTSTADYGGTTLVCNGTHWYEVHR